MQARTHRFGLIAASLVAASLASPALSQDSTISFSSGANNGARDIADRFYGASTPKTTAIVDLDADGSAEIGVKFTEDCQDGACRFGFLYYSNGEWLEVLSDRAEDVWLGTPDSGELRPVRTSENTEWNWFDASYTPRPVSGDPIYDLGEPIRVLTDAEASIQSVRDIADPTGYRLDVDDDGAQDTIVFTRDNRNCFQGTICPAVLIGGGNSGVVETITTEGNFLIEDGAAFVLRNDGFSKLAKEGQTFREVYSKSTFEVRR